MKASGIVIGGVYSDGKAGVREVISIEPDIRYFDEQVTYRILAAKVEREYSHAEKMMVSVIGSKSRCNLASFSQWAKVKVDNVASLLNDLSARKLKLPPGEKALMLSRLDALCDESPVAGVSASFAFNEMRQARGIENKGLVIVHAAGTGNGGNVVLTELGAAWMRANKIAVAA